MTKFLHIKLLISPFSLQCKTTIFSSLMLQINFGVSLSEIKQSESVILFNLFKIITTLVIKVESPSIAFIRSVVICVDPWMLSTGLVDLIGTTKATNATVKILSVNKTQTQHVEANNKILVKLWYLLQRQF